MIYALTSQTTPRNVREEIAWSILYGKDDELREHVENNTIVHISEAEIGFCVYCSDTVNATTRLGNEFFKHSRIGDCIVHSHHLGIMNPRNLGRLNARNQ